MVQSSLVMFHDEADNLVSLNDFACDMPSQRTFKDDGSMIAPATIARTGIMEYKASQCGPLFADRDPNSIVRVMTTPEELFHKDSIDSYRAAPITILHPKDNVNTENAKELRKGHLDGVPFKDEDGEHLSAHIVLDDQEAIDAVESGMSQMSSGHKCKLVLADKDCEWDAEKKNIRANHVAIVQRGRAGTAQIADTDDRSETEIKLADTMTMLTDAETKLNDALGKLEATQAKLDAAVEAKGIAEQNLKDAQEVFEKDFEQRVNEQVAFLADAASLTETSLTGKTRKEAMLLILDECIGKDFSDKSEEYIEARYEALLDSEGEGDQSISQALRDHAENQGGKEKVKTAPQVSARQRSIERNSKLK